jgi:hypothetical protein
MRVSIQFRFGALFAAGVCLVIETTDAFGWSQPWRRPSVMEHLKKQRIVAAALTASTPIDDPSVAAVVPAETVPTTTSALSKEQRKRMIREEGGPLAFDTKFGALNPFAIYYGLTAIALGLFWYAALTLYQGLRVITGGRFDRSRHIPITLNQIWGEALMFLTRCRPKMEHRDILAKFYME